jgi:hypothetical protein
VPGPLPTTATPPDPWVLARTMIEGYLRRPIALVSGQVLTMDVPDDGVVELPFRPVVSVDSVELSSGDPVPPYNVEGDAISGLPPFEWVTVVYTHGWPDDAVDDTIVTIMSALSSRINAVPPGLRSGRVGDVHAIYGAEDGAPDLTEGEKNALLRWRVGKNAATLQLTPNLSPAVGRPGGLPTTGGTA